MVNNAISRLMVNRAMAIFGALRKASLRVMFLCRVKGLPERDEMTSISAMEAAAQFDRAFAHVLDSLLRIVRVGAHRYQVDTRKPDDSVRLLQQCIGRIGVDDDIEVAQA